MKKLSAKQLSLGYVQMRETRDRDSLVKAYANVVRTTLWREHGVYHIRSHEHGGVGRLGWHRAKTYTLAQQVYRDHIRAFH